MVCNNYVEETMTFLKMSELPAITIEESAPKCELWRSMILTPPNMLYQSVMRIRWITINLLSH
jgi:hypothetical protein